MGSIVLWYKNLLRFSISARKKDLWLGGSPGINGE